MQYLVYINALGPNYKGELTYEFIFADNLEIEAGDDWEVEPASVGVPTPPEPQYISKVGLLITNNLELDVIQHSDTFCIYDAVEKIVALGWESESHDIYERIVFHFGDDIKSVEEKLYERDIILKFETK